MKKLRDIIFRLEEWICGMMVLTMLTFVFLGTVGRYSGLFNFTWGDELSRYAMIWVVFIGAGLSAYRGELFNVDVIVDKLPFSLQKVCVFIRAALVFTFCAFAIYYGHRIIGRQFAMNQNSPSLKLPMWLMYSSVPVGCFLMAIHYTGFALRQMDRIRQRETGGNA